MSFSQLYFSFDGRISRQTFWINGVLVAVAVGLLVSLFDAAFQADGGLVGIYMLLLILPSLALQAKRWHDRDKSGWWALIGLIPIVGPIWSLVELGFFPGTPGENRFGLDPMSVQPRASQSQPSRSTVKNESIPLPSKPPMTHNNSINFSQPQPSSITESLAEAAAQLKENGLLSDDEFEIVKQRILTQYSFG